MTRKELVEDLARKLGEKKPAFILDVRTSIAAYIKQQGKGCLALVEQKQYSRQRWELSADPGYVARLIAFCREKPYDGCPIDSALTKPVSDIVTEKFEKLYHESADEIASALMSFIVADKAMSKALTDALLDASKLGSDFVRNRAAIALLEQLQHFMHTAAGQSITSFLGKTVAAAVSKPIGMQIAASLAKALSVHLKAVIAKMIASGALKSAVGAVIKKYITFVIGGAIVKAVAAKFGISAAAAFAWVLIPLIIAYLAYEAYVFPDHLAEKVSVKVAEELSEKFEQMNAEVLNPFVTQALDTFIAVITHSAAEDSKLQDALAKFLSELK